MAATNDLPPDEFALGALLAPDIQALLDEAADTLAQETAELHPADLAAAAELIAADRLPALLRALPAERAAAVLEYLGPERQAEVLTALPAAEAAPLLAAMTPDERADALAGLDAGRAGSILAAIPASARAETERLLQYEPDTAGGLMTTEFLALPAGLSVEEALQQIRALARGGRKEMLYAVYGLDAAGAVVGVASLKELLAAAEGAHLADVMRGDVQSVPPDASRAEVARLTSTYDLVALPVLDRDRRPLGVVTVDDVIDAIEEEQTDDVHKLGGLQAIDEPYLRSGLAHLLRKRAGWLSALFLGEMLTATAMGHFEGEIAHAVVLALFVPLIISSGGNSGSQATSLVIRAMALREVRLRHWLRVARRELVIGLGLGVILGLLGVARVLVWQALGFYDYGPHHVLVALTVGLALVGVVTFGSVTGAMLPFLLRRLGFDPASASAPFVATLVDVSGLVIYFSVALLLLRGTLL